MRATSTEAWRMRRVGLLVAGAVLVLDQLTKQWVVGALEVGERVAVVPGLLDLTHVTNPGGVWSLGTNLGGGLRTVVFLALPALITAFAVWYSWTLPARAWGRLVAIALVVGGALGNLLDRLFRTPPEVVDFVLAHWKTKAWPAFNLADSAICVGVGILLVASFKDDDDELPPPDGPGAADAPR